MRKQGVDVELTIVGSGELLEDLHTLAADSPFITIRTGVSDAELLSHYDSADVFALLPEEIKGNEAWEGFGIVYLEAAARGCPILATRSGGVPEATTSRGAVLLSEGCSSPEVADVLEELWLKPELREEMSRANISWSGSNTWAHRKEIIERLLASLTMESV
jgi:phosphatidylinositol alpha-1,6-mannosyltransferase